PMGHFFRYRFGRPLVKRRRVDGASDVRAHAAAIEPALGPWPNSANDLVSMRSLRWVEGPSVNRPLSSMSRARIRLGQNPGSRVAGLFPAQNEIVPVNHLRAAAITKNQQYIG